jgi:hypothetical protein
MLGTSQDGGCRGKSRRWHRIDAEAKHFVEFNGKAVSSVETALWCGGLQYSDRH